MHAAMTDRPVKSSGVSSASRTRRFILLFVVACLFLVGALLTRPWANTQKADEPLPARPLRFGGALSLEEAISQMQKRIEQSDRDHDAYAQLGLLFLQRVRSSGDAADYQRADQALSAALEREPNQVDALVGKGILALALHDFDGALVWAERARAINPYRPDILGIMTDAHVELGQYDQAITVLQEMVDMRPGLNSYTRMAYVRELYGDVDGAIEAMQAAAGMGLPGDEPVLWTLVQLGNLHFNQGDLAAAEASYQAALRQSPDYVHALAGMAKVWAAQGRNSEAIAQYRQVLTRLPLPEVAIALGELLEVTGDRVGAEEQYDLVKLIQTLNASAGMDVDLEMALFGSDHGADKAAALAQAEAVYARRPTIYAADVLAWALYQNGRAAEARGYMEEALRLGTRDARLYYHAGMIALAQGESAQAQVYLQRTLDINPYFSTLSAGKVRMTLATLD
ncbi:MAG: tetratricopeptide repeat protein [Caldilineaceae bacterium]|nr:tetratricopeptide repeat protein [Caldilineaceae bacterium]